jgi:uncharacterized membrane protein
LSQNGFKVLVLIFGTIGLCSGILFLSIGAWPVFGFMGLDIVLLIWAFRASYRSAKAFEEISISNEEIVLKRVSPKGVAQEWRFNPFWSRLEIERDYEDRVIGLAIRTKGVSHKIAAFLGPQEKADFAKILGAALSEARG